jgi:3-hydroxy-9,10-secoandrosta-1,3,5(10)-triene-9,17-dione monooxygenase reductase component
MSEAESSTLVEASDFRRVLGRFCSGVTIVTAVEDGHPVGMTCQSFFSVSLDPPLIAFSPARTSTTYPRIRRAGAAAINILSRTQSQLALTFADRSADKWSTTDWTPGTTGSPLIAGAVAAIECKIATEHEAGDHFIVVAQVLKLVEHHQDLPLVFYQSRFSELA